MGRSEDVRKSLSTSPAHEPPNKYRLEDIKRWVESKAPTEVVGYCNKLGECIIAQFLLEQGYCIPEVEPYGHFERGSYLGWFYYEMLYCSIPDELAALAKRFDVLGVWNEPVCAEDALTLFEGVDMDA